MSKTKFINALYDLQTGKVLLAHPTEEETYVSPKHYEEIRSGAHRDDSTCTYSTDKRCSIEVKDPNGPGMICIKETEFRICQCSNG